MLQYNMATYIPITSSKGPKVGRMDPFDITNYRYTDNALCPPQVSVASPVQGMSHTGHRSAAQQEEQDTRKNPRLGLRTTETRRERNRSSEGKDGQCQATALYRTQQCGVREAALDLHGSACRDDARQYIQDVRVGFDILCYVNRLSV